jgi:hypothetical protein
MFTLRAKGALSCQSATGRIDLLADNQALKARFNPAWLLNPKRTAHRNQRRACEATRGIPPETSACDGALVGLFYGRNVDLASPFAKGRG